MKKNALVAFGLLVSLASAGAVVGKDTSSVRSFGIQKKADITIEDARKIALKRLQGEIDDEYTTEDDDGNLIAYVFIIKQTDEKKFEVQIASSNGKILSVEQVKTDEEDDPEESTETEEEETTEAPEPAEVEDEESTETESVEEADDAPEVTTKITIERARTIAIKKAKGVIQSEALVTNDGNAYFAFVIKSKKDKMTQVRVDANSGKAKKMKMKKAATE